MKTLITIVILALTLTLSTKAVTFTKNSLEIHEVSILEEKLNPGILN